MWDCGYVWVYMGRWDGVGRAGIQDSVGRTGIQVGERMDAIE